MLRLDIRGVNAYPLEKEVLTEGRVGLEISFTFSSEWDGLTKIAVFEGAKTIDVPLVDDHCVVPHEALAQSGAALRIGVYGQNTAGDIVIPTVWAKFGQVQPAARLSEETTTPPTPSVVAQILEAAQAAEALAQSVRDDADAGKFDGKTLFWCTYIGTTLAEIVQAVRDGLLPVVRVGGMVYVLSSCNSTVARFYSMRGGADNFLYWTAVDEENDWDSGSFSLGDYTKPASGIPKSDLAAAVKASLDLADSAYQKPSSGIPKSDLASGVQASLDKADDAIPAPASPDNDDVLKYNSSTHKWEARPESGGSSVEPYTSAPAALGSASAGSSDKYSRGDHVHPMPTAAQVGAYAKPAGGIPASDLAVAVQDALANAEGAVLAPESPGDGDELRYNSATDTWESSPPDVFWAIYGTTTSEEIEEAYQAGRIVLCVASLPTVTSGATLILVLSERADARDHSFQWSNSGVIVRATCAYDTWQYVATDLPAAQFAGVPAPLGTAARGTDDTYSRSDHVHPMPTAANVGAVASAQGVAHAGEFLVVGSDGNVTTVTMTAWQGGSY